MKEEVVPEYESSGGGAATGNKTMVYAKLPLHFLLRRHVRAEGLPHGSILLLAPLRRLGDVQSGGGVPPHAPARIGGDRPRL